MKSLEMERPMDSWNDERLDEMSRRMDEGFKEMREGFARVDERFERIDERFERVERRFERLYLVLITASIGVVVSGHFT
jgi:hypothetical protein